MECPGETAEVGCPACRDVTVLRPSVVEIWCQRREAGYAVTESRSPREPERAVLALSKKGESPERA